MKRFYSVLLAAITSCLPYGFSGYAEAVPQAAVTSTSPPLFFGTVEENQARLYGLSLSGVETVLRKHDTGLPNGWFDSAQIYFTGSSPSLYMLRGSALVLVNHTKWQHPCVTGSAEQCTDQFAVFAIDPENPNVPVMKRFADGRKVPFNPQLDSLNGLKLIPPFNAIMVDRKTVPWGRSFGFWFYPDFDLAVNQSKTLQYYYGFQDGTRLSNLFTVKFTRVNELPRNGIFPDGPTPTPTPDARSWTGTVTLSGPANPVPVRLNTFNAFQSEFYEVKFNNRGPKHEPSYGSLNVEFVRQGTLDPCLPIEPGAALGSQPLAFLPAGDTPVRFSHTITQAGYAALPVRCTLAVTLKTGVGKIVLSDSSLAIEFVKGDQATIPTPQPTSRTIATPSPTPTNTPTPSPSPTHTPTPHVDASFSARISYKDHPVAGIPVTLKQAGLSRTILTGSDGRAGFPVIRGGSVEVKPDGGRHYVFSPADTHRQTVDLLSTEKQFEAECIPAWGLYEPQRGLFYLENAWPDLRYHTPVEFGPVAGLRYPFLGDVNGDCVPDFILAHYDERSRVFKWYVRSGRTDLSGASQVIYSGRVWGEPGDVPVPADYDGDGKVDIAVWRPKNGTWWVIGSATNAPLYYGVQWGLTQDIPTPGDFDGDGKADLAVFRQNGRENTGKWYVRGRSDLYGFWWGLAGDVPIVADYTGDGRADFGVYRPSEYSWSIFDPSTKNIVIHRKVWGPGSWDGSGIPLAADVDRTKAGAELLFYQVAGRWDGYWFGATRDGTPLGNSPDGRLSEFGNTTHQPLVTIPVGARR